MHNEKTTTLMVRAMFSDSSTITTN